MRGRSLSLAVSLVWLGSALGCSSSSASANTTDAASDGVADAPSETGDDDADADVIPTLTVDRCPPKPTACSARWDTLDASFTPLASDLAFEDRAFYVFTVLANEPTLRDALAADTTIAGAASARDTAIRNAVSTCTTVDCLVSAASWSKSDADAAAAAIMAVVAKTPAAMAAAKKQLIASGVADLRLYPACKSPSGGGDGNDGLLQAAWSDAIAALSSGLSSYASGAPFAAARTQLQSMLDAHPSPLPVFAPALYVAWSLMHAQGRDEPVRYEPLDAGQNAAAKAALATTDFTKYPYVVILVPGLGPTDLTTPLSAGGRDRCDLALARWKAKLAPFIMTSGGHVHPDKTPHSEAIEMKKYLMSQGVPEAAIFVDPYARHTTTNLRNASRELIHYRFPLDRPVLVTTDWGQTLYMNDTSFTTRCKTELGYPCSAAMSQLSNYDSCMWVNATSLQQAPSDMLDP